MTKLFSKIKFNKGGLAKKSTAKPLLTAGFTLTELLLAVILTALILLLVLSVYLISQKAYTQGDLRAELNQNGRVILDRMVRELRQASSLVTVLPPDDTNPSLIPSEIQFQDGHQQEFIRYLRYYLEGTDLKRQLIVYYFTYEPNTYVTWNAVDSFGNSPEQSVLEDKLVGEYVQDLSFWGENIIYISLTLNKNDKSVSLQTKAYGRNL